MAKHITLHEITLPKGSGSSIALENNQRVAAVERTSIYSEDGKISPGWRVVIITEEPA
jgi:hypothetical protein